MLPFLAKIGSVLIPSQPVFMSLAGLAGGMTCVYLARREGLETGKFISVLVLGMFAALIGARISSVVLCTRPEEFRWYLNHPVEIFKFWKSGFSLYGYLTVGIAVSVWGTFRVGFSVWKVFDILTAGIILGHGIQNIGDFLAGAHPGKPTGLPWGVVYDHRLFRGPRGVPLHPFLLYLSAIASGQLAFVWAWFKARNQRGGPFFLSGFFCSVFSALKLRFSDGELFSFCFFSYGFFRFFAEFTRGPQGQIFYPDFPLSQSHVACIGMAAAGLVLFWGLRSIREAEEEGKPYRGWMKLCFRTVEVVRWAAKRVPWPVRSEK